MTVGIPQHFLGLLITAHRKVEAIHRHGMF